MCAMIRPGICIRDHCPTQPGTISRGFHSSGFRDANLKDTLFFSEGHYSIAIDNFCRNCPCLFGTVVPRGPDSTVGKAF